MTFAPPRRLFPRPTRGPHRRVVVTGGGIITALGPNWHSNAKGFRAGRLGFAPVTLFDVSRQRVQQAAQTSPPTHIRGTRLPPKEIARLDRAALLLLTAAHEAWGQSGWDATSDLPIILGTTSGGMALGEAYFRDAITQPPHWRRQPSRALYYSAQKQVMALHDSLGCSGPITIIANACASGSNAIGHAWETVRLGRADRVLTGGYDGLCQLVFAGFDSLQALSPTLCRPFDVHRDGLAIGEGAAVLALETLESARARNADILCEIIGYGASTDTHHLTQPHPEGHAALASMTAATDSAGIRPDDVQYVNAHGTGTVHNDSSEAAAINHWAGTNVRTVRVSSTKASVGHLLGAAGAVEAAVCLMALRGQWLPPTTTIEKVDPVCGFPVVRQPLDVPLSIALSNSFGFGGANATLIFRRFA